MYAFNCEDKSKKNLKVFQKDNGEKIKFEEYYNCLFGGKIQQECNNYILRSINHKMYLQEIKKSTLSIFDDKRCYINETESEPWN